MEKASRAVENVKQLFPQSVVSLSKRYKTVHSEIFILTVLERDKDTPQKVLVKYCNSANSGEVLNQFRGQLIFSEKCRDKMTQAPKPFGVDPKNRIIVMEYIEGTSLKRLLLKLTPINEDYLNEIIDLSAIALSNFHRIFGRTECDPISINSPLLERDVNADTMNSRTPLSKCHLQLRAKSFIDFAAGNIVIDSERAKVFLIDFPGRECVCTPHLDLAWFRFSLKVIKQYPQFRFFRMNWWAVDSIYKHFLDKYCQEMKANPSEKDLALIDWFEREYVRKLQNLYETNRLNMRLMAERIYMRRFTKTLLSINGER